MKKLLNRRDLTALGILMLLSAGVMLSCMFRGNVYGSEEDWGSQHYAFPEYFRMLFYKTHSLFPSYAANIGGGENIYALSYYGLYSPVILLSYFLPFVSMGHYIMGAGILTALLSEVIFYCFLRRRCRICTAVFTSLFFTFSLPLLLHTHRHIMFLTFMPFLLLSMHLTDLYFRSGIRSPLVLCTALMILCNYFFAFSALCALAAYGLYVVMEDKENRFKEIIRRWLAFLLLLMSAVLIAGVLLLPTAHTLLSGRDKANTLISLRSFLPTLHFDWLTYYGYTMGSSAFGIFAALYYLINGSRGKRFLAALIMLFAVCPSLTYLLNGMLYFDAKVLFAFLPLSLLLTAALAEKLFSRDFRKPALPCAALIAASALSVMICGPSIPMLAYAVDAAITAGIIAVIAFRKSLAKLSFLCISVPVLVCIAGNQIDNLQSGEVYNLVNSPDVLRLTSEISEDKMVRTAIDTNRLNTVNKVYGISHYQDTIYSSVHSKNYNHFFFEEMYNENQFRNAALTTRSRNVLFNTFMGNRYYLTNAPVSFFGYEQIRQTPEGFLLYENKNAFPMLYASDRLMSRRQYDTLSYPENIEALMRFRIVEQNLPDVSFTPTVRPADIGDPFDVTPYLSEKERTLAGVENGVRRFTLNDSSRFYDYPLPDSVRGQIILLRIYINNPKDAGNHHQRGWERAGDVRIKINGVKNTLTDPDWKYYNHNHYFEFVLSDGSDHLDIELTGRNFEISQLTVYTLDPAIIEESASVLTPFMPDLSKTKGDVIEGDITAGSDGWFASSLVYHEGFTVTVDGNPVTPEQVNLAFLGFPLAAGTHHIRIRFRAPLLNAGLTVSGIGCLVLMILALCDLRHLVRAKKSRRSDASQPAAAEAVLKNGIISRQEKC